MGTTYNLTASEGLNYLLFPALDLDLKHTLFSIYRNPNLPIALYKTGKQFLCAYHMAIDHASWRILV